MTKRLEHTFEFTADKIADAAAGEAEYHEERLLYWQGEYDTAVARVEDAIGAKIVKHPVSGGYTVEVVVDYGDRDAYTRMQEAFRKINGHRESAESLRSDEKMYRSQKERFYDLDATDVLYYRLSGAPREVLDEETVAV